MTFSHFNFNVFNLEKSLDFYEKALNLVPTGEEISAEDRFFDRSKNGLSVGTDMAA